MSEKNNPPVDFSLPRASFSFLVESLMMQTQRQLGIYPLSEDDKEIEPNLSIARHSIDLLAVLQEKTRGNLTTEENRMLENGLTELRFRYVQVTDQLNQKQPEPEPPRAASDLAEKSMIATAVGGTKGNRTE